MNNNDILSLLNQPIQTSNYLNFCEAIEFLNKKYYDDSEQIITDYEFDILFKKLVDFELNNKALISKKSPTQLVAKGISSTFDSVAHLVPMLSLSNSYNSEDLKQFDESIKKELQDIFYDFYVEPKFDGSSISLMYENDQLVRAATRGDGIKGEDITENAKKVKNIPHNVLFSQFNIKKIELRGEVVIHKLVFDKMNLEREAQGLSVFQNTRNTASGSLRLKDPQEVAARNLDAFIYSIGYIEFIDSTNSSLFEVSQEENIALLNQLGFNSAFHLGKKCSSIEEVIEFCNQWEDKRNDFEFDIDGMVVKLNQIKNQMMLGFTSHHPKWAIAYKFKAIEKSTKLLEIDFQVGRTGIVTPVAKVEPVSVGGVTIRSISLHNEDNIISKDLRIGDTVFVERAGDVIPQISRVDLSKRETQKPFVYIQNCPTCQTELIRKEGEAAWRCLNFNCESQLLEKIIYFSSKESMNIKGLGKDIIKRFFNLGIIKNYIDIYQLDYEFILSLEGWKSQSVENLKTSIEESKNNELYRLINALGIDNVGNTMSKILAKKVNHLLDFQKWSLEDFNLIEDIGPKMAQSLFMFFNEKENINLLQNLEHLGVNLTGSFINIEGILSNQVIVFSGFRDTDLELKIESLGGTIANSLSKKTTILVMKEIGTGSSKESKAKTYGTLVYDLESFKEFYQI
jgi:DNA ligase (NAD+)